ncbi:MAG: SPOR domain-containing protein [Magnetococcales bacterium]|nr:SPOR domain-containing protein [Magnetococcales bacterium]
MKRFGIMALLALFLATGSAEAAIKRNLGKPQGVWYVLAGGYASEEELKEWQGRLKSQGHPVVVERGRTVGMGRVMVGPFGKQDEAEAASRGMNGRGGSVVFKPFPGAGGAVKAGKWKTPEERERLELARKEQALAQSALESAALPPAAEEKPASVQRPPRESPAAKASAKRAAAYTAKLNQLPTKRPAVAPAPPAPPTARRPEPAKSSETAPGSLLPITGPGTPAAVSNGHAVLRPTREPPPAASPPPPLAPIRPAGEEIASVIPDPFNRSVSPPTAAAPAAVPSTLATTAPARAPTPPHSTLALESAYRAAPGMDRPRTAEEGPAAKPTPYGGFQAGSHAPVKPETARPAPAPPLAADKASAESAAYRPVAGTPPREVFWVLVGHFAAQDPWTDYLVRWITEQGGKPVWKPQTTPQGGEVFQLWVGPYPRMDAAVDASRRMQSAGQGLHPLVRAQSVD